MPVPIVIVDDADEDLFLSEHVIRQCKIQNPITLLRSGEECLRYFRQNRASPVLLFLDMRMAPMTGLEVLRTLRAENLARDSSVVMLSGLTDVKSLNAGYQLGARTFLVKPLRPEDVLDLLSFSLEPKVHVENSNEGHYIHWRHAFS